MAQKTPINKLNNAISGILSEYESEISENVGKIAVEMGKKGAQALRKASRKAFQDGTGKYASGWKSQAERGRLRTTAIIYNDHYSMPHLLEYGHATRNGTDRVFPPVEGREHIAPIANQLTETFEREVVSKL